MVKWHGQKQLAVLSIIALVVALMPSSPIFAARPDSLKDTLSDSRPSTAADHTIVVGVSSGTTFTDAGTVIVTFPSGFDLTALTMTDVDFLNGSTNETLQSGACGATDTIRYVLSSQTVTFTACNSYTEEAAGTDFTLKFGSNASGGTTRIVNTTAGTHTLNVAGTYGDDSQDTILVVTAAVTVSATIDETLTNSVAGLAPAACDTSGGTEVTTTSTTVPFSTITTEAFYDGCQQLTVGTNAAGGYTVTAYTVAGLDSGANPLTVGSCDGSCTLTTPSTWATATNNGYAICMKDETGDAGATANAGWDTAAEQCGGGGQKFELVADKSASETYSTIMSSAAAVSGDISEVGWRLSADSAQAAGAYTGTADYITTGTF